MLIQRSVLLLAGLTAACGGGSSDAPVEDAGVVADAPIDERLGFACTSEGALGCQGLGQKLQLRCENGVWVSNGVCPGTQVCDARTGPDRGTCQEPCTPLAGTCKGKTLVSCDADQLTVRETECATEEHCKQSVDGRCAICLDGQSKCEGTALVRCAADRQGFATAATCASEALCDAAKALCRAPTCDSDEHRCVGDALEKCRADRTGFEPSASCGPGLCDAVAKACKTVCAIGEYRCTGDLLETCNPTRTGFTGEKVCGPGLCDAAGKECDECVSGSKLCVSATPRVCSATGHWTDLAACAGATPICSAGACIAGVCTTGEARCVGNVLERCNSSLTAFEPVRVCAAGACNATLAQCDECSLGDARCVGATPVTCSATLRWSTGAPCSGATPYCIAGACAATPSGWVDMASVASIAFAGRSWHTAIWTGTTMIVWGGAASSGPMNDGAVYDPSLDVWAPLPTVPLIGRFGHVAVWTGSSMIVWGGTSNTTSYGYRGDGAVYQPSTKTWTLMPSVGAPSPRVLAAAVWSTTTNEMIVWGGAGSGVGADGARFSPSTGWRGMSPPPAGFAARRNHQAVWTGTQMIVFGGEGCTSHCDDAAAYDPVSDGWAVITPSGLNGRREFAALLTTGTEPEVTFWGGIGAYVDGTSYRSDGATFLATTRTWVPMVTPTEAEFPTPKRGSMASWASGRKLYLWGGTGGVGTLAALDSGAVYDLSTKSWSAMPTLNAPSPRSRATAVWTGKAAIVWGGTPYLANGKLFYP
ncbi:MAG: hypothetical protein HYV09_38200 [Deltaproteobacteria bacterium]|nr:hypothetical protein [Deltaproteobacteria bacterium]